MTPVHAVHSKETTTEVEQLRHMLERMSKKFESFEQQLKELDAGRATDNNSVERERRSSEKRVSFKLQRGSSQEDGGGRRRNTCFLCGKEGHWKRECTLNFNGSAPTVDGAGAKGSSPPNIQASQQVTCTITSLRIQY